MRKSYLVLLTTIILLVIIVPCHAAEKKNVGIFLDAPVTYVNNETVRKEVPEKIKDKLASLGLTVLPFDDCQLAMRTYREDNRMVVNQYYAQSLNRFDIQKIAQGLDANYAIFIQISNDAPRVSSGLFSISFRTTVTCDIRILDATTGNYTLSKQIIKDGSSTAILAGVPSFENAYREALNKGLDEIAFTSDMFTTKDAAK